ncbi:MAG: hypothetical protein KDC87_19495 [Planctomycetes bacterium]|nr:hypothetical protein [Planctomycetota bacterium]MCB9870701.1 hypothetical protein [Planctomycetota bacterium]
MLSRLLHLQGDELLRLRPFFSLYFLLFAGLTLGDGVALSLFVEGAGAESLPRAFAAIAIINLGLVAWYFFKAQGASSTKLFAAILISAALLFVATWVLARFPRSETAAYAALFVSREIALTMVLLHFGTYLQDYFSRDELNRVMPVVYAGGRAGGIFGAALLEHLSRRVGLPNMVLLAAGLMLAGLVVVARRPKTAAPTGDSKAAAKPPEVAETEEERLARTTLVGFLRYVRHSRLLFWITAAAFLFMMCRWMLNYQYTAFLGAQFLVVDEPMTATDDETNMAEFLGWYTQIALAASLLLQLFGVSRLIRFLGLGGAHTAYSTLVVAALLVNLLPMTLGLAVTCRFVETELRFGLRNPLMQLITNRFSKPVRIRVRSWTLGILVPLSTIAASALLSVLVGQGPFEGWLPWVGGALGFAYLACSVKMARTLRAMD